uniref:Uncharacterized protein n=1 Tax=Strigamia maritima TaxID=126957 RepID=T1IRF3_STRMM
MQYKMDDLINDNLAHLCATFKQIKLDEIQQKLAEYSSKRKAIQDADQLWIAAEMLAVKRANIFILPRELKTELEYAIAITGIQIREWLYEYLLFYTFSDDKTSMNYPKSIIWTIQGTVDKKKSFELLLHNQTLQQNGSLFNLACILCLRDHILDLWTQLPMNIKNDFQIFMTQDNCKVHFVTVQYRSNW